MDPWYITEAQIAVRLGAAVLLGGLIGFERERHSQAAGFRTHIMVCLGAALVMLLSVYGFAQFAALENVQMDPARLAAQVISGIGFLGAGTIIYTGRTISGLTTAASLWVVAAIGLAIGAGFYTAAGIACVLSLMSLWVLQVVERKFMRANKLRVIKITALDQAGLLTQLSSVLKVSGHEVTKVQVEASKLGDMSDASPVMVIEMTVRLHKRTSLMSVADELQQIEGVSSVMVN